MHSKFSLFAACLAASVGPACADSHGAGPHLDAGPSDAGPRTCEVISGSITLVPAPGNPPGCEGRMTCDLWFGHGQHLTCPEYVECDIWDCVCTDDEGDGLAVDFSTGEVVDARDPERVCRFTLRREE